MSVTSKNKLKKQKTKEKKSMEVEKIGFIASGVERLFRILSFFPPQCLLSNRVDYQRGFTSLSEEEKLRRTVRRAKKIDRYICVWIAIEILFIFLSSLEIVKSTYLKYVLIIFITLRIIDIIQVNINLNVFDYQKKAVEVGSVVRLFVNVIINFIEMIICFGILYSQNIDYLKNGNDWTDAYYFSAITQLTIGYGDILPTGYLKLLACFQGLVGFLFSVLIISKLVSLFPNVKAVNGDDNQ